MAGRTEGIRQANNHGRSGGRMSDWEWGAVLVLVAVGYFCLGYVVADAWLRMPAFERGLEEGKRIYGATHEQG